jgi:hypothetical protein
METNKPLPQYVTKFIIETNKKTQENLLQYTNENIELIVSIIDNVIYNNNPNQLFETKAEFMKTLENIDEDLLIISPNKKIPVLP